MTGSTQLSVSIYDGPLGIRINFIKHLDGYT